MNNRDNLHIVLKATDGGERYLLMPIGDENPLSEAAHLLDMDRGFYSAPMKLQNLLTFVDSWGDYAEKPGELDAMLAKLGDR